MHPKFVVNEQDDREAVFLDIKEYDALIEELEDLHDVIRAERIISTDQEEHNLEDIESYLQCQN